MANPMPIVIRTPICGRFVFLGVYDSLLHIPTKYAKGLGSWFHKQCHIKMMKHLECEITKTGDPRSIGMPNKLALEIYLNNKQIKLNRKELK